MTTFDTTFDQSFLNNSNNMQPVSIRQGDIQKTKNHAGTQLK